MGDILCCFYSDRTYRFASPQFLLSVSHLKLKFFVISQGTTSSKMSAIRQNYPEECEALVNKQINMELYASYVYQSMAYHFDRDDVALDGFFEYFKKESGEERGHAEKFMGIKTNEVGVLFYKTSKHLLWNGRNPLTPWKTP